MAFSQGLHGAFSEAYVVGDPANTVLAVGAQEFGNWDGDFTIFMPSVGTSGYFDTTGAPDSITISVTGGADFMMFAGSAAFALSYDSLPTTGTISFDVDSIGGLVVSLDSTVVNPTDNHFGFNVLAGQTLTLTVSATGIPGTVPAPPFDPGSPGIPVTNTVTISNFTATSAVPEPSTYAALAGILALGLAVSRRRSKA